MISTLTPHELLCDLRISEFRGETDDGLKDNGRHDYCSFASSALACFRWGCRWVGYPLYKNCAMDKRET